MPKFVDFSSPKDRGIRTLRHEGQLYYVLTDVVHALGHSPTSTTLVSRGIPAEDVSSTRLLGYDTKPSRILVTEAGFYHLLLSGRGEGAARLKRFVTEDVLPAIRQSGRYISPSSAKRSAASGRDSTSWKAVLTDPITLFAMAREDIAPQQETSKIDPSFGRWGGEA